ncbi:MAG: DUF835 domain-containing protein [Thermoplasmatota archaeon]
MREVSPLAQLLDQWLLLPLFVHLGLLALLLLSARGRVGWLLSALLCALSADDLTCLWPALREGTGSGQTLRALEAAMVALFILGYTGGKHLRGRRIWQSVLLFASAPAFLLAAHLEGWGPSHPAHLAYSAAMYILALALLYTSRSEAVLSSKEPHLLGSALALLFVAGPVYDAALPALRFSITLFPYSSALASAVLAALVRRYKAFTPLPVAEGLGGSTGSALPRPGTFLATGQSLGRARDIFTEAVRAGVPGLMITCDHPSAVRAATGLRRVPIIWLAQSVYEKSLPPGETDVLLHTIRDYIEQQERSVVIIEHVDYIITNAGYFAALDLFKDISKLTGETGATVLLSSARLVAEEERDIIGLGITRLE